MFKATSVPSRETIHACLVARSAIDAVNRTNAGSNVKLGEPATSVELCCSNVLPNRTEVPPRNRPGTLTSICPPPRSSGWVESNSVTSGFIGKVGRSVGVDSRAEPSTTSFNTPRLESYLRQYVRTLTDPKSSNDDAAGKVNCTNVCFNPSCTKAWPNTGRNCHRNRSEERRVGKECRSRWSP